MTPFEILVLCALAALVALAGAQIAISLGNRKGLERLARGEAARAMLAHREVTISDAPFGPVAPLPKLSSEPAKPEASPPSERTTRVEVPGASGARSRPRETFKAPELGPMPDYAAQARRPAPDAEPPDSSPAVAVEAARDEPEGRVSGTIVPPPPVESAAAAPTVEPARAQPDVGAPPSLATLARALDESDQGQAEQAPAPRVPTTRPPPSSQQEPARSGAHVAVAPPASAPVLSPAPGIVAAGLGERPSERRGARSERPPPHKPPVRGATLLGIHPPKPATTPPPKPATPKPATTPPPPVATSGPPVGSVVARLAAPPARLTRALGSPVAPPAPQASAAPPATVRMGAAAARSEVSPAAPAPAEVSPPKVARVDVAPGDADAGEAAQRDSDGETKLYEKPTREALGLPPVERPGSRTLASMPAIEGAPTYRTSSPVPPVKVKGADDDDDRATVPGDAPAAR